DWQAAFVSDGLLLSPPQMNLPAQAQVATTLPISNPIPSPSASPVPLPLGTAPTGSLEPIPVPTVTPTGSLPLFPQPPASPPVLTMGGESLIQAILIDATGQVLLRGDRPFSYRGAADPATNTYNLIVEGAAIAPNFVRPALPATSPIERIRLTTVGNSVTVGIKVSPGWRVQDLGNVDANQIALQVTGGDGRPPALPNVAQAPMPATRGRGVVLIDPGHGGRDPGAVANNVREKDVVLSVGLRAGQMLQQMGYTVVYSRTDDREVELAPRVQLAEQVRADVFVSVHANAVDPRMSHINGLETFHSPNSAAGRRLAEFIQREALAATGANDRGVKTARFYVVHRTSMPSVLLETGFVTNPQEARNLTNPAYQDRLATAIARGVAGYLQQRA
ncbi:MAG: N-acetylmuramoyl-L-alanine amidase, partial [Pseudanabaenaceae cyanobacterium]